MPRKILLLALILYIVSAATSYASFSYFIGGNTQNIASDQEESSEEETILSSLLDIDPAEPKDQSCPINGKMYTKTESEAWSARRPLFVMVENSPDARPQSGLSNADVVFEAIAEGGVTRFGVVFYCGAQAEDIVIAPIRSARTYFVDWASGFNRPMYVHVGGANVPGPSNALGQIGDYGWNMQNDLNQFSIGYPTFYRDYNRVPDKELATEHTMVTSTEKLWVVALKREWTNMSPTMKIGRKTIEGADWKEGYEGWAYEEEASEKGEVTNVSYDFWSGYNAYSVAWSYDSANDMFLRNMAGEKHIDLNNDEQVAVSNVVVLLTDEKGPINEKKHMLYKTTGKGDALIFKHGNVEKVTWVKKTREAELTFVDKKGKDVALARGSVWVSIIDKGNEVEY